MRILLTRLGALGDLIATLPALRAIREKHPGAQLTLLSNSPALKLFFDCGAVDAVEWLDDPFWNPFFVDGEALPDLSGRFEMAFVWLKAADDLVVKNLRRSGLERVYAKPSFPRDGAKDSISKWLMVKGDFPLFGESVPRLILKDEDRISAREELKTFFEGPLRPVLALHPGAGNPKKRWPAARFAELGARWIKERQGRIVLVEGPADAIPSAEVQRALSSHAAEFRTLRDVPLTLLAGLLQAVSQYVGNDSGVSHLAAAVGTPSVVLFGETDPAVWAPRGFHVKVLRAHRPPEPAPAAGVDEVWKLLG